MGRPGIEIAGLHQPLGSKAKMSILGENDMVIGKDTQRLPDCAQVTGKLHVGSRGRRISARMIVGHDQTGRILIERGVKHAARVDLHAVMFACKPLMADRHSVPVEQEVTFLQLGRLEAGRHRGKQVGGSWCGMRMEYFVHQTERRYKRWSAGRNPPTACDLSRKNCPLVECFRHGKCLPSGSA